MFSKLPHHPVNREHYHQETYQVMPGPTGMTGALHGVKLRQHSLRYGIAFAANYLIPFD